jgi:hypothetical protein
MTLLTELESYYSRRTMNIRLLRSRKPIDFAGDVTPRSNS